MAVDLTTCKDDLCSTIVALNQQIQNENTNSNVRKNITWASKSGHNFCAFVMDGEIYTTNGTISNSSSQSGRGISYIGSIGLNNLKKVIIPNTSGLKKVGHSGCTSYALYNDGKLYVWGKNNQGQCGLGHTTDVGFPTLSATDVLNVWGSENEGTHAWNSRFFILKSDGLYACGYNGYGQLGVGDTDPRYSWTKCSGFTNNSSSNILDVYVGGCNYGVTVILITGGYLYICGLNNYGQLGLGSTANKVTFTDCTLPWAGVGSGVTSMKIGGGFGYDNASNSHSNIFMLLTVNGSKVFKGSGCNTWYNLGINTTTNQSSPVAPSGIDPNTINDIAVFGGGPCTIDVLMNNGDLYVWGYNSFGQGGNNTTVAIQVPTKIETNVLKLLSHNIDKHYYSYYARNYIQKADGLYMTGEAGDNESGTGKVGNILKFEKIPLPIDDCIIRFLGEYETTNSGNIVYVVTTKNNLYAWGYNGQNGVYSGGTTGNIPTPLLINDTI